MADELKDQRIPIMMTPSEVAAIDDWMFANRIKSRAEAIRRLCQMGLALDEHVNVVAEGVANIASSFDEFGRSGSVEEITAMSYVERINKATQLLEVTLQEVAKIREPLSYLQGSSAVYKVFKGDGSGSLPSRSTVNTVIKRLLYGTADSKIEEGNAPNQSDDRPIK